MRITKRSLESALQSYNFSAKYATLTALLPAVDRYSPRSIHLLHDYRGWSGWGGMCPQKRSPCKGCLQGLGVVVAEREGNKLSGKRTIIKVHTFVRERFSDYS